MTTELWPIIHDISHVIKMRKEVETVQALGYIDAANALAVESSNRSADIKKKLKDWKIRSIAASSAAIEGNTNKDHGIQSIISNAEAYHHATYVFFHRNIECEARSSSVVQYHTKETLAASLRVVMFGGPMAALLWPLFVGACEAVQEVDRRIAGIVFQELIKKQGFVNISQSWEIVQELWQGELVGTRWEEICQAHGLSLVFA